jgi:hypothetical protein
MRELTPQGLDFLASPPEHMDFEQDVAASADAVFAILADTDRMSLWLDDFVGAEWLGEPRGGAGSRRRVRLRTLTVIERFVAWEPGKRFAFTMEAISLPIVRAVGEDMRLEAVGEGRCRVRWRVAYDPVPLARLVHPLIRWNFGRLFRKSLVNLKRLAER